jgi:hypothetical protein
MGWGFGSRPSTQMGFCGSLTKYPLNFLYNSTAHVGLGGTLITRTQPGPNTGAPKNPTITHFDPISASLSRIMTDFMLKWGRNGLLLGFLGPQYWVRVGSGTRTQYWGPKKPNNNPFRPHFSIKSVIILLSDPFRYRLEYEKKTVI